MLFLNKEHQNSGFTLLEIMISMAILAFISVLTATSIQSAIKFKAKTITKIEETSFIYDALKIMAEDIRLAYNYKDINIEVFNLAQEERQKRSQQKQKAPQAPGDGTPPDGEGEPPITPPAPDTPGANANQFAKKKENRLTHFLGQKDKLNFTSLSYSRTVENSQYSSQSEVGYYVADCRGRLDKRQSTQCLWRRISPIIDENIEEGGTTQILLENVSALKMRYLNSENEEEEWRQDWMSDDRGDVVTKGKFPFAVEVTLETKPSKPEAKPITMTIVAPLSFPNNQLTTEEKANEALKRPNPSTN